MYQIIIALLFLILFCQSFAHAITIAVSVTPLSAPILIADELDYFKQQGLDINLEHYIGGNRTATALLEGKAEFATSSEAVVMFKSFKYDNFAILTTFVESNNDVKLLTHRQSAIHSINDLSHHRVGTIMGASAHFFLDHTLLMNGVNPATVEVISIKPEETAHYLKTGKVDAVSSWEPFIHLAKKDLGDDAFIIPHDKMYTETFNLLVQKEFAKNNVFILKKILKALQKAIIYINNEPLRTQQIIAKCFKKDIQIISSTWEDYNFNLSLHQSLISTLEAEARWALKRGFAKAEQVPNYLDIILTEPLNSISNDTVTIIH